MTHRQKSRGLLLCILCMQILPGCAPLHRHPGTRAATSLGTVSIHFLDVGYGAGTLILQPPDTAIVIDGGYQHYGEEVLRYLQQQGVRTISLLVSTHPHPDHIGGLSRLAASLPVALAWGSYPLEHRDVPEDFRSIIATRAIQYLVVRQGQVWEHDGLQLKVLNPVVLVDDMNDSSLVIRLQYGNFVCLLAADCGPAAQQRLVKNESGELPATVVQIPHHGGEGAAEFVAAVKPALAVLSVGPNSYKNPHAETLSWYMGSDSSASDIAVGSSLLRTDSLGTIVVRSNGSSYQVECLGK